MIFNTHTHLNSVDLYPIYEELIKNANDYNLKKMVVVGFDLESSKKAIEIAEKYIGYSVYINKEDAELDDDMYFFCDLEGCTVIDNETKEELGVVESVEEFPAQLTLSVKSNKTDKIFFVPFVEAFVVDVDIENKKIYINVIKGLID